MRDAGRVIAGTAGGIRLDPAPSGTRPLTERVKESLFGGLEAAGALEGPFLDLFAGSGAAGIEALSRGAPSALFVERDDRACQVIAANLRRTHLEDRGQVRRAEVVAFLAWADGETRVRFAACLIDPPYGETVLARTLELLGDAHRAWLQPGASVVAKHFWRDELPERAGVLERARAKRFGETALTFYTRSQEDR